MNKKIILSALFYNIFCLPSLYAMEDKSVSEEMFHKGHCRSSSRVITSEDLEEQSQLDAHEPVHAGTIAVITAILLKKKLAVLKKGEEFNQEPLSLPSTKASGFSKKSIISQELSMNQELNQELKETNPGE